MKSIGGVKDENGVSSKPSEEVKAEPEKIDFSNVKIEPLFEEEELHLLMVDNHIPAGAKLY